MIYSNTNNNWCYNTEWNIDLLFDGISQMTSDDLSSSIKVYSTEINQSASSRLASGLHDW